MYYITAMNRTESGTETVDVFAPHKSGGTTAEGSLKQEENKIDNLTLTIYPQNPAFEAVKPLVTRIDARDLKTGEVVFSGRALTAEDGMDGEGLFYKTVTCEGALGYLCDSAFPNPKIAAGTTPSAFLAAVLANHNSQFAWFSENMFHMASGANYTTPVLTEDIEGCRTTWEMVQDFLSQCGGVLKAVYDPNDSLYGEWAVQWTPASEAQAVSEDNSIELGENMLNVTKTFEFSGVCTRLYAFGKKNEDTGVRVGISGVNGGAAYIVNEEFEAALGAPIYGVYVDDEAEDAAALLAAARNELAARARAVTSISAGAIDAVYLDEEGRAAFQVGKVYRLKCAPLGISENVRVVGRSVDINAPYKPTLTLGAAGPSMSGMVTAGAGASGASGGGAGVSYTLSKSGNQIILTGSDGSVYSVSDSDTTYDLSGYLPKAGGTMTGALTLYGAPTANLHAATKKYVDDKAAGKADASALLNYLPLTGGTVSGDLIVTGGLALSGAPTADLMAATKAYVDEAKAAAIDGAVDAVQGQIPNIDNYLPWGIENGGTGATTAEGARANLGVTDVAFATCDSLASSSTKTVTIVSGTLTITDAKLFEPGARLTVRFYAENSASNPKLRVGYESEIVPIYWHGSALPSTQYWQAGAVLDFVYNGNEDGGEWELIGVAQDNNTDTGVYQYHNTGDNNRPLLLSSASDLSSTATYTGGVYRNNSMYGNPSTGTITSKYHELTETPTADNHAVTKKYVDDNMPGIPLDASMGGTGWQFLTTNALLAGNWDSAIKTVDTAPGALYATEEGGASKFGTLPVLYGGTGATTAAAARTNLGAAAASDLANYLPLTGGTLTGDLRLKDSTAYGRTLYWGDGSYVYIKEPVDDIMELHSKSFRFTGQSTASENPLAVNQGGTGSTTASGARSKLEAAQKWTLLWTNSSPSSNFAAQTVTISTLSSYNLLFIEYLWSTTYQERYGNMFYCPSSSTSIKYTINCSSTNDAGCVTRKRGFYKSGTSLYFYEGCYGPNWEISTQTDNSGCIPYYIFGSNV